MDDNASVARTLAVAGAIAFVCAVLVSAAVYWLRPYQLAYRSIDQYRAILVAAGALAIDDELSDREIVGRFAPFKTRVIDLDLKRFAAPREGDVDYRSAMSDPALTRTVPAERDMAGIGRQPRVMPAYLLERDGELEVIVLPVFGRGMWSTIHGFVGLRGDLTTLTGVRFYELGETPGIGDRIQDTRWTALWVGKRMYDDQGSLVLRIGGRQGPDQVDAITGATITVTAVDRLIAFWFGPDGYRPFLEGLKDERS